MEMREMQAVRENIQVPSLRTYRTLILFVLKFEPQLCTYARLVELGHLEVRSVKLLLPRVIGADVVDKTGSRVEWVVKTLTDRPVEVIIVARCPRVGTDIKKVILQ
jgi:hypothetical protein